MTAETGPTPPSDRYVSLDALRGFALLGILLINIQLFAMPQATGANPTAFGDLTGANFLAWLFSHVFAEQKFMTLFTVLFGAGIALFTERKEGGERSPIGLHFRRTFWLLVIGLAHAYLLWYGDILVAYAICGFWVVWLRNWRPTRQVGFGLSLVAIPSILEVVYGYRLTEVPERLRERWNPPEDTLAAEVEAYRGGWFAQFDHRFEAALELQTVAFVNWTFWRVSGLMLVGMALYRWGVLSNRRPPTFYRRMAVIGTGGGLALILPGVFLKLRTNWAVEVVPFFAAQFNYWGSLLLAGAYVALLMLWCESRPTSLPTHALAAVGRTAFSNYLLQTVIATTIFYGHGFGLFASVSRTGQLGLVVAIWTVQVVLSMWWLRHFRYGPVEWLWRVVTYGKWQPLRTGE